VIVEIAPIGAMLLLLGLASFTSGSSGYVVGFLVLIAVQCVLWGVAWWLLAAWLSRSTPLTVAGAVLVVLASVAPIYGEGGHGTTRFVGALEKYRDQVRWTR
jgi:hypothetical protein